MEDHVVKEKINKKKIREFQTFEFDVPWEQIRDCSLEVSVMDFDTIGRNELIGKLMLGGNRPVVSPSSSRT